MCKMCSILKTIARFTLYFVWWIWKKEKNVSLSSKIYYNDIQKYIKILVSHPQFSKNFPWKLQKQCILKYLKNNKKYKVYFNVFNFCKSFQVVFIAHWLFSQTQLYCVPCYQMPNEPCTKVINFHVQQSFFLQLKW